MSASSRKWYSGKSLQDSKVFEDFPALSATFANSYKSEEKHYDDDDFPRGGKVPYISYSDKLQKNTKTLLYFNQDIDLTECFSSSDEGAEGPQVNGTRQNTPHYLRTVNDNFSLVSRSYTNCGVNQIAKSKNYDMKNVLKCNAGNHVRNSVIKQFNENKAVSSKWCADRDIGQTKSKCIQSGSQNVSVRETKSGLRIFDSEKQIIQKFHCNLENDCGNNSIMNKTRSVHQNHGNKKLHWKTEVPTAVECCPVSPKDQNRNHWDEMCNFNNKEVQEQQQQSANKHFCTQHSVNNNPKKQQSVNFPLNKQQQSVNFPLNKQQQCTDSYLSRQRTKPRDNEPYKSSRNKTASNSSEIYHNSVDSSSSKNNIKDVLNVKKKATRFSAKPDQEPEAYKKKKKRLSKIKRQTAFQTGKVLLLSPEFHSRIVKNLTDSETVGSSKNDTININSLNEYPSLVTPANTDRVKNSCNESHAWGHLTQKSSGTCTEHQPSLTEPKHDEMPDRTTYHILMRSGNSPLEKEVPQPVLPPNGEERKDDGWQSDGSWKKVHRKTKECPREPIQLFDILAISKPKEKSKKKVEIIPKSDLEKPIKVKGPSNAPNVLDSSAPVKRGKEREHPKQKKVTPLKKIILSERLKKRGLGISNTETTTSEDCSRQHENSKPLESNDGIEETKILSCIAEENETAKVEGTCSKLDFPNSSEVSVQGSRESVDPYSMDIELIADTAEAIVDQILELAVAKVRTMGLNVNAACFEILDSPEKLELASPDSLIDENPLKCEESSQHSQDTVEHIIFPEIQDCSEVSKETNEQNKCESDAIEVVDFRGDADITSNKDEGYEDDVPSKWDESQRQDAVQAVIHHRNFREYCTHLLSKELNEAVLLLIDNLARFQDRQHQKDPVKARMKRRLIYGIKEVKKYLKLKKLRCIIIAPDLENIEAEGGLNAELAHIIKTTKEYHIPCIFASDRKHLGRVCHKPVPVSCLGVFSYEGSEAAYRKIMELHAENTKDYEGLTKVVGSHMTDEDIEEVLKMKEILEVKEKRQTVSLIQSKILTSVLTRHVPDAVEWFSSTYQLKLA